MNIEISRIAITDLADELQCRKQSLFKIAKRLGIEPVKERSTDRHNQLIATVSAQESLTIRKEFSSNARARNEDADEVEELIVDEGFFYLVQLEPQHDPGRIKVGFTTNIDARLQKHRCAAPFIQCVKVWPCRKVWERAAIDCVSTGLEQLHTEVFRTNSVDDIINRANRFFSIMPPTR